MDNFHEKVCVVRTCTVLLIPRLGYNIVTEIKRDRKEKFSLFAKHAIKYYLVGASGVLVNLGILYVLTDFIGVWYLVSYSIAIYISITTNFFLNNAWTFSDAKIFQKKIFMYGKFLGVSLLGMGLQLGCTFLLVERAEIYYMLAALISIGIASSINFLINRRWTFGIKF